MEVGFVVREILKKEYLIKIKTESQEEIEDALDEIGESVAAQELCGELRQRFGNENVIFDDTYTVDGNKPIGEYEWVGWEEELDNWERRTKDE